ncbi:MAG: family 2 glycosyl transferase [Capsulimonas sp.]|nr:family 2 glycosyl transferase [Capsulimonas sp.]
MVDITISIVIPALNEREALPETIAALRGDGFSGEIIIADGGSTDGTVEWAQAQAGVLVVPCGRGRGVQLNAGAQATSGDVLAFLHADCKPPAEMAAHIQTALSDPNVAGGAFCVRFEEQRPWTLHATAWFINNRSRQVLSATGDQAIFARRTAYDAIGDFHEWPLFEDMDFVTRLRGVGRFRVLSPCVTISARRWLTNGVGRTNLLMARLYVGYRRGVAPEELARRYRDVRKTPPGPHWGSKP